MADTTVRFIHISDTHISPDPDYKVGEVPVHPTKAAKALVEQVNDLPFTPDFVLHTGDIVYDADEAAYAVARDILGQINAPVYYIAGNHDDSQMMQRIFLRQENIRPYHFYSFDVKDVQFVCLDSTGPAEPPSGSISSEQLEWLENLCKEPDDRQMIVAVHHNVLPVGSPWLDEFMRMDNGEELHRVLLPAREKLLGVFHGHIHQNQQVTRDNIIYTSVLSSWYQLGSYPGQTETLPQLDAQPGYNVVTVTPEQVYVQQCRYSISGH